MELNSKCLLDFWIWYLNLEQRKKYKTSSLIGKDSVVKIRFLAMSFTERFGVYEDYLDSKGIEITVNSTSYRIASSYYSKSKEATSRQEARIKAIEKANEIVNSL